VAPPSQASKPPAYAQTMRDVAAQTGAHLIDTEDYFQADSGRSARRREAAVQVTWSSHLAFTTVTDSREQPQRHAR